MKKTLLLLFILVGMYGYGQVMAVRDSIETFSTRIDTFDIASNDTFPSGDSVCITILDSNSKFSVADCRRIVYSADSFYSGIDSIRYALCDTATICDTATVIIHVRTHWALLPTVRYVEDYTNETDHLFHNIGSCAWFGNAYTLVSKCINADSILWSIESLNCADSLAYFQTDTINFVPEILFPGGYWCGLGRLVVHLTAYNRFGTAMRRDTTSCLRYDGVLEISLPNISLYPSPSSRQLTVDMEQNTDAITSQYNAIDIINMLGQKLKSIPRNGNSKTVQLNVADLPEGIYNATITDDKGATRTLGRFTIAR